MKTQGIQPVKNKGAEDSHEDEPDHLSHWLHEPAFVGTLPPDLQALVSDACKEIFMVYTPATHSSWKELEADVIKQFGRRLHNYKNRDRLRAIVINVLIRAKREIKDETHLGEM